MALLTTTCPHHPTHARDRVIAAQRDSLAGDSAWALRPQTLNPSVQPHAPSHGQCSLEAGLRERRGTPGPLQVCTQSFWPRGLRAQHCCCLRIVHLNPG
ncbi:hypothetical protein MUG91_G34n86 [Manis pentadactyla]|nr:hypothetical protein MUG91_G34n86 [Manis pentadactyla]